MQYWSLLFLLFVSACSILLPEPDKTQQISRATSLYSCHFLFKETAETTYDLLLQSRLSQISDSLLLQAKRIAMKLGGEVLNDKISKDGQQEFDMFMAKMRSVISIVERNQRFKEFSKSCADMSGIILNAG